MSDLTIRAPIQDTVRFTVVCHLDDIPASVAMLPLSAIHRKATIEISPNIMWCVIQIRMDYLGGQKN